MATKLRLISGKIHWPLLAKAGLLGLVWLFAPFWLFALVALYLYFSPYFQPLKLLRSLIVFLFICYMLPPFVLSFPYITAFFISCVFYLLLGVKDLVLINRQSAYQALRFFLISTIFVLFFWWGQSAEAIFVPRWLGLFVAAFMLYREYLWLVLEESSEKIALGAILASVIIFELAWVLAWLPIGFLNATAVLLLAVFILDDFIMHHFKGDLDRQKLLSNFTVFVFSLLIIFALSDWTIK